MSTFKNCFILRPDVITLHLTAKAVESAGFRPYLFREPTQFLSAVQNVKCDLIFTDLELEGIYGWTFIKKIRFELGINCPIILSTFNLGDETIERSKEFDIHSFLPKAFHMGMIRSEAEKIRVNEHSEEANVKSDF